MNKQEKIAHHFRQIMKTLGMDLKDDSLKGTPQRVAKMYLYEIFEGLDENQFPSMTTFENKYKYDEMLIEKNIDVKSYCEHHFQPIIGHAHIAYIPDKKVIGLSKLNRVVEFFSRRPQVQERLTKNIIEKLVEVLETPNVAVAIDAEHFCIKMRGVNQNSCITRTTQLSGSFKEDIKVKSEFLSAIGKIE